MKKESITAILIAALMAGMYISGLPAALVVDIAFADVDPVCITLLINIVIAMIVGALLTRLLIPGFDTGLRPAPLTPGIRRYGLSCLIAAAVPCAAFCVGLPLDHRPTAWRVIIEFIVYYMGVGLIEEFFCRGLLQTALAQLLSRTKRPRTAAVVITAVLFGLGHIAGVIGMPLLPAVCKVVWAIGLGIYLGAIYAKTGNLWLAALFHFIIDLCGLPFCFSTQRAYPPAASVAVLCTFAACGAYGLMLLRRPEAE